MAAAKKVKALSKPDVEAIFARFHEIEPEPKGELDYVNAFTLLVAVVLSAQATDAGVNKATKRLFELAPSPAAMVALGVERIAELAAVVNDRTENIGARRLHTVMERLLDQLSFDAPDMDDKTVTIDEAYVDRMLADIVKNEDLSRYIL